MSAKTELLERLKYIDTAALLPELIDISIGANEHNHVANLLRKGLSIVAFNVLEDYIKNKSIEALNVLSSTYIPFSNLPECLQEAAISNALNSLSFQSKIFKKDNPNYRLLIQEETRKISTTALNPYEISKYSLLSSGSNVLSGEITDFLKAFGISKGWNQLKIISDAVGGGIPDLAQAFSLAAQRRHSSAHSASFNYNSSWLANLKSEILSISASIDIVITSRCRQADRRPLLKLEDNNIDDDLNFRFLEANGTIFRETKSIGGRSIKNWSDIDAALAHHSTRIEGKKEFVIVLNANRRIMDWLT